MSEQQEYRIAELEAKNKSITLENKRLSTAWGEFADVLGLEYSFKNRVIEAAKAIMAERDHEINRRRISDRALEQTADMRDGLAAQMEEARRLLLHADPPSAGHAPIKGNEWCVATGAFLNTSDPSTALADIKREAAAEGLDAYAKWCRAGIHEGDPPEANERSEEDAEGAEFFATLIRSGCVWAVSKYPN